MGALPRPEGSEADRHSEHPDALASLRSVARARGYIVPIGRLTDVAFKDIGRHVTARGGTFEGALGDETISVWARARLNKMLLSDLQGA